MFLKGTSGDGSMMGTLSRKWRDISYPHQDVTDEAVVAEAAAPLLSQGPAVDELFAIDRSQDEYSQVGANLAVLLQYNTYALCNNILLHYTYYVIIYYYIIHTM